MYHKSHNRPSLSEKVGKWDKGATFATKIQSKHIMMCDILYWRHTKITKNKIIRPF